MRTILWDWNGTLIDDAALTVEINRQVFERRGYRKVTLEEYRELFRFPVREYYAALGVTDEDFPAVAREWFEGYTAQFPGTPLHADAAETVARFCRAGFRQVIVSASRQTELRQQVAMYPALEGMFEEVLGLSHHLATSKVDIAKEYMARAGADPEETWFLGDTCHDAEVARTIGCRCLLITGGHQSESRLAAAGCELVRSRREAADRILGE